MWLYTDGKYRVVWNDIQEKDPRNISLLTCKVCVCVRGGGGGGEKHKNKYIIYAMLTVINDHFVNWKTKLSMQKHKMYIWHHTPNSYKH